MNNNYLEKYLKYKNKYLELKKNQIGGIWNRGPLVYREHYRRADEFIEEDNSQRECPICGLELENIENLNPIKLFPCGHTFHDECINRLILESENQICPICQRTFINYYRLRDTWLWTPIPNNPHIIHNNQNVPNNPHIVNINDNFNNPNQNNLNQNNPNQNNFNNQNNPNQNNFNNFNNFNNENNPNQNNFNNQNNPNQNNFNNFNNFNNENNPNQNNFNNENNFNI